MRRGRVTVLNKRQREVLAGRARGLTYAELSRTLYLSESTLRGYWRDLSGVVSSYLQDSSPGDIERALGLGPGDLWPGQYRAEHRCRDVEAAPVGHDLRAPG